MARLLLIAWSLLEEYCRTRQETHVNYTHYDFLDLAPGADSERVEAAYVATLERMQYGASDAGQDLSGLVRRIHAAYDVLSDPYKRNAYDASLAAEAARADVELKSLLDKPAKGQARRVQDVPGSLAAAVAHMAA
jgi:DnaJ-class molecular chaperone